VIVVDGNAPTRTYSKKRAPEKRVSNVTAIKGLPDCLFVAGRCNVGFSFGQLIRIAKKSRETIDTNRGK